jgi:hypothetical protein
MAFEYEATSAQKSASCMRVEAIGDIYLSLGTKLKDNTQKSFIIAYITATTAERFSKARSIVLESWVSNSPILLVGSFEAFPCLLRARGAGVCPERREVANSMVSEIFVDSRCEGRKGRPFEAQGRQAGSFRKARAQPGMAVPSCLAL